MLGSWGRRGQVAERSSTARASPTVFLSSSKKKKVHTDSSYECTVKRGNAFEKSYSTAWPLQGETSSDHAVQTVGMYKVTESHLASHMGNGIFQDYNHYPAPFHMTAYGASLKILTALLPQSHHCSSNVSRPILAPPML